jgi:hypothetical protein
MPNEAPAIDWAADVKRYVPDADNGAIAGLVRYCLVALKTRDTPVVSFGNPAEIRRVRENFCKKTLGLAEPDGVLDAAIARVGQRMGETSSRNRVTAYYLLAEHFGKLGLFGVAAAVTKEAVAPVAKLAEAVRGGFAPRPAPAGSDGFIGYAMLVGALGAGGMLFAAIAGSYIGGRFDAEPPPPPAAPAPAEPVPAELAPAAEAAAPADPESAATVSEVVEGRP